MQHKEVFYVLIFHGRNDMADIFKFDTLEAAQEYVTKSTKLAGAAVISIDIVKVLETYKATTKIERV